MRNYHPVRVVITSSLISYVLQRVKPQSRIFRILDLRSKSSHYQAGCSVGSARAHAASGFLNRGAQIIYRISCPAAIGARVDYEMNIPKHDLFNNLERRDKVINPGEQVFYQKLTNSKSGIKN
jgi:hypothetical protein